MKSDLNRTTSALHTIPFLVDSLASLNHRRGVIRASFKTSPTFCCLKMEKETSWRALKPQCSSPRRTSASKRCSLSSAIPRSTIESRSTRTRQWQWAKASLRRQDLPNSRISMQSLGMATYGRMLMGTTAVMMRTIKKTKMALSLIRYG